MKKYTLIIAAFFATGAILSGCKKDFLSQEVNPNTPSVTTPQFALAGAEKIAADIPNLNYTVFGIWVGYASPSGNFVPSPSLQQYQFTTDNFQVFVPLFANATNFNNLQVISADASLAKFKAIAMIMKAYDFQQLVDLYDNVPYTQAFQASTYLFPKYDKGKDIYADLVVQLTAAKALIDANAGATDPGASDIIFKGDMAKWKRFANSLILRLAIRQSKSGLDGGTAKAALPAAAGSAFVTDDFTVVANPGYTGGGLEGQQSPFWRAYGTDLAGNAVGTSVRAGNYGVELLRILNDPRLGKEYSLTTSDNVYRGIVLGDPNAPQNPRSSTFGPGLLKAPTMDAVIMSSAESLFLQAEAVQKGWITGDAQDLYQRGITASFVALGLTAAQATTYYSQDVANVGWTSSSNKLQAIITQKYLALNGYSFFEAWNEYKRTGFPAGIPRSIDTKAIGTTIPNRIYYPTTEYQQNADAVGAEGTIDPFTSKIFWQP
ncbi:SusD/RagB family nutrient-binding outer membrane lipoprotein [Mucilaginibacter sp. ZT4R22]|uniref:SusD/RagB family nutrient-binding outer membrane lipoprotein n=1 Tax=Mucilaginibacter pankratovii TaxID=2772110 RepID=A0ABR7WMT0_9SPHI|nr:SusD/RagB family nutrient-binding outer membrane lipoprotein [Mucilaginibacter pankratovii]MBD1363643.1 SusD/RagB family nutrient-binding outer membrane lipoprotein [Mucilaginibacter pankratovii]